MFFFFLSLPFLFPGNYKLGGHGAKKRHFGSAFLFYFSLFGRVIINRTINKACWKRKGNIKKRDVERWRWGGRCPAGVGGGSEDATLFRDFISGEIKNPAQGHGCSICFADSALGSPSMPVNINQARHLNATGPNF